MYIKRKINGEEKLIEITKEEKVRILEEYLSEIKELLVFDKEDNNAREI